MSYLQASPVRSYGAAPSPVRHGFHAAAPRDAPLTLAPLAGVTTPCKGACAGWCGSPPGGATATPTAPSQPHPEAQHGRGRQTRREKERRSARQLLGGMFDGPSSARQRHHCKKRTKVFRLTNSLRSHVRMGRSLLFECSSRSLEWHGTRATRQISTRRSFQSWQAEERKRAIQTPVRTFKQTAEVHPYLYGLENCLSVKKTSVRFDCTLLLARSAGACPRSLP